MKTVCVLIVFAAQILSASELIDFKDTTFGSWNDVKTLAAKEKKLIFLDAFTDWCSWCKVMDRETFSNQEVADFMNKNFVNVRYEMETGFGIVMSAKYRVNAFPSFLIFSSDGKPVYRIIGFVKPAEFMKELQKAIDPAHQDNLTGISNNLKPGFPEFYMNSFGKKGARQTPDQKTVNEYLASAKDLDNEVSWSVMYRFSHLLDAKYKDYIFNNFGKLKTMYGANDVESSARTFISMDLRKAIQQKEESALESIIAQAQKYLSASETNYDLVYRLQYYRGTEQWEQFASLIEKNIASLDEYALNSYSWTIYEKCEVKNVLSMASGWMKEVTAKAPKYMFLDTYAALLFKSGDLNEAKKNAQLAIEAGKEESQDIKETEELLQKINNALQNKI